MATIRQIKFLLKRFKNKKKVIEYLNDLISDMTNKEIANKYNISTTQVQRDKNNFIKKIIDKKVFNYLSKYET